LILRVATGRIISQLRAGEDFKRSCTVDPIKGISRCDVFRGVVSSRIARHEGRRLNSDDETSRSSETISLNIQAESVSSFSERLTIHDNLMFLGSYREKQLSFYNLRPGTRDGLLLCY
jgi:hypothetical protein